MPRYRAYYQTPGEEVSDWKEFNAADREQALLWARAFDRAGHRLVQVRLMAK